MSYGCSKTFWCMLFKNKLTTFRYKMASTGHFYVKKLGFCSGSVNIFLYPDISFIYSFISCETLNFCFHLIYIFKYRFTFTLLVYPAVKWKLPSSLKEDPVVWGFIMAFRDTLHVVGNPLAGLAVQASHKSQIVLQKGFSKRDRGEQTAQKRKTSLFWDKKTTECVTKKKKTSLLNKNND